MNSLSRFFLVLAVLVSAIPVVRADDSADALPSPPKPGRFTLTTKSGGFDRVSLVHVPAGYKSEAKPPLVLLLHGAGGGGEGILDRDGWAAKADKEGFVAVAPDGLPAHPRSPADFYTNPAVWNAGQLRAHSQRSAIDDVAFVRQLLDELKQKVPYDESRVFCAGHSNGGGMAFRLASDLSERFTAVGMVAGVKDLAVAKPKRPLPTLYIIGMKDPVTPIEGGEVKLPWGTRQNPPVAKMLETWAEALGCQTEPKTISDKDGVKTEEYASNSNGPTLSVIYIEGQGHNWPGGKHVLPESKYGPATNKLDATDALWNFFKASNSASAK